MGGWGVQNYGKLADIILERSLKSKDIIADPSLGIIVLQSPGIIAVHSPGIVAVQSPSISRPVTGQLSRAVTGHHRIIVPRNYCT